MKKHIASFILVLSLLGTAVAQRGTSQIDVITIQQAGANVGVAAGPFALSFTGGCVASKAGITFTITCVTGTVTNYPGGSDKQVQLNHTGTAFDGVTNGALGTVLAGNGVGAVAPTFMYRKNKNPFHEEKRTDGYMLSLTGVV